MKLLLYFSVGILLASCGGGGSDNDSSGSGGGTPPPTTPTQPPPGNTSQLVRADFSQIDCALPPADIVGDEPRTGVQAQFHQPGQLDSVFNVNATTGTYWLCMKNPGRPFIAGYISEETVSQRVFSHIIFTAYDANFRYMLATSAGGGNQSCSSASTNICPYARWLWSDSFATDVIYLKLSISSTMSTPRPFPMTFAVVLDSECNFPWSRCSNTPFPGFWDD